MKYSTIGAALVAVASVQVANAADPGDPRFVARSPEPACNSMTPAAVGGPTLRDPKNLLVRWMGYSNYEVIYGDHVILLDQWYDRDGTQFRDIGFRVSEVKRADLLLVGHAHWDHMADTAQVAIQTHAPVLAAPLSVDKLAMQSVDPAQLVRVDGTTGRALDYRKLGFTVTPILARHGEPPTFTKAYDAAGLAAAPKPTPEEAAALAKIRARGSADPRIVGEGTIAYVFTFDDGFKLAWRDSGGTMTDAEKDAMKRIGPVDVLLGAVAANVVAESQAEVLLPMLDTYRPAVWIPGHHEEQVGGLPDRATEPLIQYAQNAHPDLLAVSKPFRQPTCFDTRRNRSNGFEVRGPYDGRRGDNGNLKDWDVPGLY
jgi:L-ascorbate metabolism protein UlaG (beta-lactamase superfamily)